MTINKQYFNWSNQQVKDFRKKLLDWYDKEGRDLPWRRTKDPYKIWVSEIMLQQTQVSTVISYYERFIKHIPTIPDLAVYPTEDLLNLWQGLGYYSRVKNMQIAAQQIVETYEGQMPTNMKDLLTLKGIGPYTAAAIASMAFNIAEPAIDGNLMRVTARLFEIEEDISRPKSRKVFKEILDCLIDPDRPGDFNQAMMDVGATIMTPSAYRPENHFLQEFDQSYQNHTSHLYPVKKKKTKQLQQEWLAFQIQNGQGHYLMRQHQVGELLEGLWHYPLVQLDLLALKGPMEAKEAFFYTYLREDSLVAEGEEVDDLKANFELNMKELSTTVQHIFSHRKWQVAVLPVRINGSGQEILDYLHINDSSFIWVDPLNLENYALSKLQLKLFDKSNE